MASYSPAKMLLARALYDNVAETPEELAFRRGDVLSILEQNASGLDGWWLCGLHGRTGIAPGNRLKLLDQREASKLQNKVVTPHRVGNTFIYDSPQNLKSSPGASRHNDYDIPPSRSPIPPSRGSAHPLGSSLGKPLPRPPAPRDSDYDTPKSARQRLDMSHLSVDHYDTLPGSKRSSTVSVGSSISAVSSGDSSKCCESERSSLDLSAHDAYDVPAAARAVGGHRLYDTPRQDPTYDTPRPHGKAAAIPKTHPSPHGQRPTELGGHTRLIEDEYDILKPNSGGYGLYNTPRKEPMPLNNMYDSPKNHMYDELKTQTYDSPRSHMYDSPKNHTYDSPKSLTKPMYRDSGIVCPRHGTQQMYDNAPAPHFIPAEPYDSPKQSSVRAEPEYDTPKPSQTASPSMSRKATPSPSMGRKAASNVINVYDVPPRVTKDTDNNVPTETITNRESSGSNDSDIGPFPYDELRMELGAAMEALVSLQHHIKTSCTKLLNFVHPTWRTQEFLEPRVYEVKLASVAVGKAGDLFLEFGQGALVNASKSDDKRLTKKLCSAVDVLGDHLTKYGQSLTKLNKEMWPLVSLVRPADYMSESEDDLDIIVRIAGDIPDCVRTISGLVQGNSMALFKRSVANEPSPTSTSTPSTPAAATTTGSAQGPVTSTPRKNKSPPPPTKPKPRLPSVTSPENTTGAPMPKFTPKSPPATLERVPLSPQSEAGQPKLAKPPPPAPPQEPKGDGGDYDVPKPHLAKLDNDQPSNSSSTTNVSTDNDDKDSNKNSPASSPEEIDYVALTRNPVEFSNNKEDSTDSKTVEMREKPLEGVRSKVVQSLFPPPEVRTSGLTSSFKERLEKLQQEAEEPVRIYSTDDYDVPQASKAEVSSSQRITSAQLQHNDRIMLQFYAGQVHTHSNILVNAIEAFIKCVDEKQGPKTFVAYSKFVILAAHKMVYIGDTLTRHLVNDNVRNDVMNHAYTLCELLKDTVTATKKAALEYPAVTSVQDMVDRVSEVSLASNGLKHTIARFS